VCSADKLGEYSVIYSAEDSSNNTANVQLMILAVPANAPRIFLQGLPLVVFEAGDVYQDAGASASDTVDGDVSSLLTSDVGTFTPTRLGEQEICYSMSKADSQGLFATSVCRDIQVIDTTPPVCVPPFH
jgi:hypothetical protein